MKKISISIVAMLLLSTSTVTQAGKAFCGSRASNTTHGDSYTAVAVCVLDSRHIYTDGGADPTCSTRVDDAAKKVSRMLTGNPNKLHPEKIRREAHQQWSQVGWPCPANMPKDVKKGYWYKCKSGPEGKTRGRGKSCK